MTAIWLFLKNLFTNDKRNFFGGLALFLLGGGMIETVIMDFLNAEWSLILFMLAFGAVLAIAGLLLFAMPILRSIPTREELEAVGKEDKEKESRFAASLREFREALNAFFISPRQQQNDPIQDFVTQVYFQILSLQKRRLDKNGILLNLHAEEQQYSMGEWDIPRIQERSYDDGKYKIAQIKQQISGKKTFLSGNTPLYQKKESEMAHYTLLTAFQRGNNKIVCPSCGNTTTRENLLDGCDYCRTKFMVEDLNEKAHSFSFRSDYAVEYAKYKKVRKWVWKWGVLLGGIPGALYTVYGAFVAIRELAEKGETFGPFVTMMGTLIAMLAIGLLSTAVFFMVTWFLIFPIVQTVVGLRYLEKRKVQRAKERAEKDEVMEDTIRRFDGRFSLQGFYGSIQSKLAGIHFSENEKEINAFSTIDLQKYLQQYQRIIDLDVDRMQVEDYEVIDRWQKVQVLTVLNLLELNGKRLKKKVETIRLHLKKSASCKTQEVTGPEVIRCAGCGASISLLEGKNCRYCGSHIPLAEYDWVITGYEVV